MTIFNQRATLRWSFLFLYNLPTLLRWCESTFLSFLNWKNKIYEKQKYIFAILFVKILRQHVTIFNQRATFRWSFLFQNNLSTLIRWCERTFLSICDKKNKSHEKLNKYFCHIFRKNIETTCDNIQSTGNFKVIFSLSK